VSEFI